MSKIKTQTIQNIIFSYLGVAIGFVTQIYLIPVFLTKAQNGLLGVLMAYMYILVQVGSLGFNTAGSRFFPKFRNSENGHNGFVFTGLMVSLVGFLLCSIALLLFENLDFSSLYNFFGIQKTEKPPLLIQYFNFIFTLTLGTILFNFFDNYAKNLYDTASGTFLSQFVQRFLQFLAVGVFALQWLDYQQFMWLWLIGIVSYVFPMIWRAVSLGGFSLKPNFTIFTPSFTKQFMVFSGLTVLTGFSTMIIQYVDKIMLVKYVDLDQIGIYNTSIYFISVMGMALIAVNKASAPIIADAFEENNRDLIQKVYRKSCITQLIFGGFVYLGIILNFDSVFSMLKDQSYLQGKWVVIIFGLGKLFDLATGLNGLILTLSKYYRYDTYSMIGLIIITISLNVFFIPKYGIVGAAIVAAIVTVYFNLFRFLVVWIKLGYQPFNFDFIKIILFGIVSWLIISLLPTFSGSNAMTIATIIMRSSLLTVVYGSLIYFSKVSIEINSLIDKGLVFFRRK